jgi:hypothetical protein
MKNLLKITILKSLRFIKKILKILRQEAIPVSRHHQNKKPYDRFVEDELEDCYNHFKKYFSEAVFLDKIPLREFALKRAIRNHKTDYHYLEFGVWVGTSINFFSKILKDKKIYGFDSFEGLNEDWLGTDDPKGTFNLNKKVPKLNKNCIPVVGLIQETLPKFISENKNLQINFVHLDLDTYPSTKFVLNKIKPYLVDGAIILFDELYNVTGWRVGEYKALTEVFNENEYNYLAFSKRKYNVAIQYKKL